MKDFILSTGFVFLFLIVLFGSLLALTVYKYNNLTNEYNNLTNECIEVSK